MLETDNDIWNFDLIDPPAEKADTSSSDKDTTTTTPASSSAKGKEPVKNQSTATKPVPGPKKPSSFNFMRNKLVKNPPASKTSLPKYPDPEKAAIITSLQENSTYDTLWTLCWEVNLSFMTKASVQRSRCLKCNSSLADSDGSFHSGFLSTATYTECGHAKRGAFCVCQNCDEDLVFDLTTVKVQCPEKGCKEEIKVDRAVVTDKLSKERTGLLDDYLALLNTYQADTFSCAICLLDVDRRLQPRGKVAPDCRHAESSCCTECLQQMIDSAVRNAMWGDLKCPELDCQSLLDESGVKKYSSEQAYTKWEKFQLNKILEGDEEFRWCPGQNFTCCHGQLHPERDSQPRIICSECDTHHCYTCRVEWHRGQTCAEYQAGLAISQSEALILKTTKRCPARGCGVPIEKREACLEVSHKSGCNTNFCWDCKAILGNDIPHSERVANRHFSTCKAMEVRHCDGVAHADKPPKEGNDKYRENWADDPEYERSNSRDGEHMYCRGCTRERCKEIIECRTQ
ncbi:Cullin-9 [Dactylellina cionopaga]|nr:Cullin-9 [Dactylellina cionopaga]